MVPEGCIAGFGPVDTEISGTSFPAWSSSIADSRPSNSDCESTPRRYRNKRSLVARLACFSRVALVTSDDNVPIRVVLAVRLSNNVVKLAIIGTNLAQAIEASSILEPRNAVKWRRSAKKSILSKSTASAKLNFGKEAVDLLGQQHTDQMAGSRTLFDANASALVELVEVVPYAGTNPEEQWREDQLQKGPCSFPYESRVCGTGDNKCSLRTMSSSLRGRDGLRSASVSFQGPRRDFLLMTLDANGGDTDGGLRTQGRTGVRSRRRPFSDHCTLNRFPDTFPRDRCTPSSGFTSERQDCHSRHVNLSNTTPSCPRRGRRPPDN